MLRHENTFLEINKKLRTLKTSAQEHFLKVSVSTVSMQTHLFSFDRLYYSTDKSY